MQACGSVGASVEDAYINWPNYSGERMLRVPNCLVNYSGSPNGASRRPLKYGSGLNPSGLARFWNRYRPDSRSGVVSATLCKTGSLQRHTRLPIGGTSA